MAYLSYNPENPAEGQAEDIEIIAANDKDAQDFLFSLLGTGIELYQSDSATAEEVHELYESLKSRHLPPGIMAEIIDQGDLHVVEATSGLSMFFEYGDSKGFAIVSDPFDPGELNEDGAADVARADEITHDAFQMEPYEEDGVLRLREHYSYGSIGEDGSYQPIVVALNHSHPIRTAIEERRGSN